MMTDIKQVKVDNWGIYFLQRLKHFFNRTDYCDLTLQFQDNAQLKVHRLVLSACTEYFELLERTCEMYEDCMVMPDDLQADVVVPIVNFMYTGQLEFRPELLEKLYLTSQVMNMPVLTKLLDAHRIQPQRQGLTHDYRNIKSYSKTFDSSKHSKLTTAIASTSYMPTKRSYSKAFENSSVMQRSKKQSVEKTPTKPENVSNNGIQQSLSNLESVDYPAANSKKQTLKESRPTRYELPEELDVDNVFDNSFTTISYTSTPLMVHPETVKRYSSKKGGIFDEASSTKRFIQGTSTIDLVECKKISMDENIFEDDASENIGDDIFPSSISINSKEEQKDASQLFDQILDSDSQKTTIETLETDRNKPKLDHAKIISEVLKKYPHLVKSNKNIKLKILNTPGKTKKSKTTTNVYNENKEVKPKKEPPDFTYETDVIDSKEAAKLIAMGAENIKGPWICLICGTPGRALHFTSYYKFRRHLVDVHYEKPIPNICEYCGLKSLKRNYILHHLYTKHGVEPPSHYHFPKCNHCNYVALTEAYLVKHKLTHVENRNFGCNVCAASFNTSNQLLVHIQKTGHKYSAEKKIGLQCIYCLKTFSRETNLYTHLKINHKQSAQSDGIIDESDEEKLEKRVKEKSDNIKNISVKYELPITYDSEYENLDLQFQIHQKPDGNIHVLPKSPQAPILSAKHKILNSGFNTMKSTQKSRTSTIKQELHDATMTLIDNDNEGIVMIDGNEYILKDNQLVPKADNVSNEDYLLANVIPEQTDDNSIPSTSEFSNIDHTNTEEPKMIIRKTNMNAPIQIVVSNEEEYKALMSSNHSIISEDGVAHKTLTMLKRCVSEQGEVSSIPTTSIEFPNIHHTNIEEPKMVLKKTNMNQPIQIVVSNEEEYKALMASNHSIIFEEGVSNKTLTVLTAQQNTSLEGTTIDLDNAQSNDMMIIQEDYPLNVTEAVPADNSNIVVVYSHPVDDQNKQYQYITSQGIETQFIQSSAMINHNYETITTSTPVMSAHITNTHIEGSFQNNIKENIHSMQIEPQLPPQSDICNEEKTTTDFQNSSHNRHGLQETVLPKTTEVTITTDVNPVKETGNNTTIISTNDIIANDMDQVLVQEVENIPSTTVDVEVHNEQLVHKEIQTENSNESNSNQEVLKSNTEDKNKNLQVVEPSNENFVVIEQTADITNTNNDTNLPIAPIDAIVETEKNTTEEEYISMNDAHIIEVPMSNIKVTVTKVAKEQIQSLTSEWSEDENGKETIDNVNTNISASKNAPNLAASDTEAHSTYTEESIENIQQEMEKQIETIVTESNTLVQILEPQAVVSVIQATADKEATEKKATIQTNIHVEEGTNIERNTDSDIINNKGVEINMPLLISTIGTETVNSNTKTIKIISDIVKSDAKSLDSDCSITEDKVKTYTENVNFETNVDEATAETKELTSPEVDTETEETLNSTQEDKSKQPLQHTVTTLNKTAHDKISSLLNDWEDNDSQEDPSKNKNEVELPEQKEVTEVDINKEKDIVLEKSKEPSNDKIKSLVSDWDDDDEDESK